MAEIIIKNSFWKSLVYALLSSVVGVSFVWIGYNYLRPHITSPEKNFSYWIATGLLWFGVLMFWLLTILMFWGAYYFFRAVFDLTPQIIFDEKGIFSKKFKTGKVFWSEIKEAYLVDSNTIRLKLNNENKYLSEIHSSKILKMFPNQSFNLGFFEKDMNSYQALQVIESQLKKLVDLDRTSKIK